MIGYLSEKRDEASNGTALQPSITAIDLLYRDEIFWEI